MAEKTKIKAPDDDLAFNFDDFSFEEPKDDRKPSKAFGQSAMTGLKSGFTSKLTDPEMYREIYRDVLPPGYDRALTTVETAVYCTDKCSVRQAANGWAD